MSDNVNQLYRVLAEIDALTDDAVGLLKTDPQNSGDVALDLALDQMGSTWGGDKAELLARRQWLRGEVLRRVPKVGLA